MKVILETVLLSEFPPKKGGNYTFISSIGLFAIKSV